MKVRVTINYKGRVQGVGYRWRVAEISNSFECSGYVQNLMDGSVELLIEGERLEVLEMVDTVDVQLKEFWHEKTMDEREGDAQFKKFRIKY